MKGSHKTLVIVAIALVAVLGSLGVAYAITNGQPDGDAHPYVGLVLFYNANGVPLWRCSSSLISPTVLLTAGHCTDGAVRAQVWFDAGPIPRDTAYTSGSCSVGGPYTAYPCAGGHMGTPNTNPKYRSAENPYGGGNGLPAFSYRDTGVVVLDTPVTMARYAQLPTAGQVDELKNKTPIDFVGYGVQYQAKIPGNLVPQPPPYNRWTGLRIRLYAPSELVSGNFVHAAEYLRLALNPGGGSGGTCFGDSGGPDLLGGTDTVLGVNSYVTNVNCSGVGYSARVDVPETLDWIESFLP
jgi:hypothetical protein